MRNVFISGFAVFLILFSGSTAYVKAQDTSKRSIVKKAVVNPAPVKPAAANPATGKPAIPINPKTGRPYTKYGYGAYANNRYDATKAAQKADSIKKAAALKATPVPPPAKPVVTATVPDTTKPAAPAEKSLNGQYQYLLTKVYNYQQPLVAALWKNVLDTLNANRHRLVDAQAKAADQAKTISSLQAEATAKDETVSQADEISLLGLSITKTAYSLIMWGLVIICGGIAVIVIARSGSLKNEATYRTSLYTELEEEFKAYKSKANEKEKKLARELQTERNKVDELMGRG